MSLTNSSADVISELRGSQLPRLWAVPEFETSTGEEAIELAALAGIDLDEWQQFVLINSLGERADGKWAAPNVCLICPRQNGKNSILEARELAGLFLLNERVIIHSAHQQATASEQFERVLSRIEDTPSLKRKMLRPIRGKGNEAIEMRSGARILFKTRTGGGGRGFTVDTIILDEAYELPEGAISALMPTRAARSMSGNIQTWYTSSAVDQQIHQNGLALTRQRERGMRGDPKVAFFEWSAEGDDPSRVPAEIADDPAEWAKANPGFAIRISQEYIEQERDGDLGPRGFAVERLGIGDWPSSNPDDGRVVTVGAWSACVEEHSTMSGRGVLAFDVAPDFSMGTIAGAGYRDDGKVHIGLIARERRTKWIPGAIADYVKALRPELVVADASGGVAALLPELEKLGVEVTLTSARDYAQACMMFAEAVNDQTLAHLGEPPLLVAIDGAETKPLADGWKWARRGSGVADISPLVAATLAHWGVAANVKKTPEVWSIREMLDELRAERADQEPETPQPGGVTFVPFDQVPWG